MKKIFGVLLFVFAAFIVWSFTILKPNSVSNCTHIDKFLNDGDTISFGQSPLQQLRTSTSSIKIGSYDGKRLEILDTSGRLIVSNIKPSSVLNSSDFLAVNVTGKAVKENDTLSLNLSSDYDFIYVFRHDTEKPIVEVFGPKCNVRVISKTLNKQPAQIHWSSFSSGTYSFRIDAIPDNVKIEEISKPIHPEKTVATFDFFEITDGSKMVRYDNTDVVMLGGTSLLHGSSLEK